jgi:hypothetical protein
MRQRGWGDAATVQREEREMTGHGLGSLGRFARERESKREEKKKIKGLAEI